MKYEKLVIEIPKLFNLDMIDFNKMRKDLTNICHCVSLDSDLDSYVKIDAHVDCLNKAKAIVNNHIDNGDPNKIFNKYGMVDLNDVPIQVGDVVVYSTYHVRNMRTIFDVGTIKNIYQVYCQDNPSLRTNLVDVVDNHGNEHQLGTKSIIKLGV